MLTKDDAKTDREHLLQLADKYDKGGTGLAEVSFLARRCAKQLDKCVADLPDPLAEPSTAT